MANRRKSDPMAAIGCGIRGLCSRCNVRVIAPSAARRNLDAARFGPNQYPREPAINQNSIIGLLHAEPSQTRMEKMVMSDLPALFKAGTSAWRQQREPTKLECGLLGALLASIVLAFLFRLGIELSMLTLVIP